jgi:hypothetical protein
MFFANGKARHSCGNPLKPKHKPKPKPKPKR